MALRPDTRLPILPKFSKDFRNWLGCYWASATVRRGLWMHQQVGSLTGPESAATRPPKEPTMVSTLDLKLDRWTDKDFLVCTFNIQHTTSNACPHPAMRWARKTVCENSNWSLWDNKEPKQTYKSSMRCKSSAKKQPDRACDCMSEWVIDLKRTNSSWAVKTGRLGFDQMWVADVFVACLKMW